MLRNNTVKNTTEKLFYVFNRKYAIKLRKKGFRIIKRTPNYKFPEFDMYGFKNTPEFRNAFEEVTRYKLKR